MPGDVAKMTERVGRTCSDRNNRSLGAESAPVELAVSGVMPGSGERQLARQSAGGGRRAVMPAYLRRNPSDDFILAGSNRAQAVTASRPAVTARSPRV